jgi:hypothetical protein
VSLALAFDATTDEHWMFGFLMPGDYLSGGTLRGCGNFASATSGNAYMKAGQVTATAGSVSDFTAIFAAADLSAAVPAPGTAGLTVVFTITLTTTAMAANQPFRLFIGRDADNGSDTATGDFQLTDLTLEYTA